MLKVQFRPGVGGDRNQPLITNCDGSANRPAVGIVYDNVMQEVVLLLQTVNDTGKELRFSVNVSGATTSQMRIHGGRGWGFSAVGLREPPFWGFWPENWNLLSCNYSLSKILIPTLPRCTVVWLNGKAFNAFISPDEVF